jgi:hypothetical protein
MKHQFMIIIPCFLKLSVVKVFPNATPRKENHHWRYTNFPNDFPRKSHSSFPHPLFVWIINFGSGSFHVPCNLIPLLLVKCKTYGVMVYYRFLSRFSRGSVQTTLPPNKKQRSGRLCSSFDDQIKDLQRDASNVKEEAQQRRRRKRDAEESLQGLQEYLQSVKVIIAC